MKPRLVPIPLLVLGLVACGAARAPLDLSSPRDNLRGYVKARGSLDPREEVVFYWAGVIYAFGAESQTPAGQGHPVLLRFEGVDVARFERVEDGYVMLSRAAVLYEDPRTGRVLECWLNPLNDRQVSVVHVWNDPLNVPLPESRWSPMPATEADGRVIFSTDMLLAYPSPLPVASYPSYSAGDVYRAAEFFHFSLSRQALEDEARPSAPVEVAWTRVGPYLPWMQMGQAPGLLLYRAQGRKLPGGWAQLPAHLRDSVLRQRPEFQHAPERWVPGQRNTTTWSAFKQRVDGGGYSPACTPPEAPGP